MEPGSDPLGNKEEGQYVSSTFEPDLEEEEGRVPSTFEPDEEEDEKEVDLDEALKKADKGELVEGIVVVWKLCVMEALVTAEPWASSQPWNGTPSGPHW